MCPSEVGYKQTLISLELCRIGSVDQHIVLVFWQLYRPEQTKIARFNLYYKSISFQMKLYFLKIPIQNYLLRDSPLHPFQSAPQSKVLIKVIFFLAVYNIRIIGQNRSSLLKTLSSLVIGCFASPSPSSQQKENNPPTSTPLYKISCQFITSE